MVTKFIRKTRGIATISFSNEASGIFGVYRHTSCESTRVLAPSGERD